MRVEPLGPATSTLRDALSPERRILIRGFCIDAEGRTLMGVEIATDEPEQAWHVESARTDRTGHFAVLVSRPVVHLKVASGDRQYRVEVDEGPVKITLPQGGVVAPQPSAAERPARGGLVRLRALAWGPKKAQPSRAPESSPPSDKPRHEVEVRFDVERGRPLVLRDARVSLDPVEVEPRAIDDRSWSKEYTARHVRRGVARVRGVPAGRYRLTVLLSGDEFVAVEPREIDVPSAPIRVVLVRTDEIHGRIDGQGVELGGVLLWRRVVREDGRIETSSLWRPVSSTGAFSFRVKPGEAWDIFGFDRNLDRCGRVEAATAASSPHRVALNDRTSSLLIRLGRSLSTRRTAGIHVLGEPWPGRHSDTLYFTPEGTLELDGLLPGTYRFELRGGDEVAGLQRDLEIEVTQRGQELRWPAEE